MLSMCLSSKDFRSRVVFGRLELDLSRSFPKTKANASLLHELPLCRSIFSW